jgi:hypothetical protein
MLKHLIYNILMLVSYIFGLTPTGQAFQASVVELVFHTVKMVLDLKLLLAESVKSIMRHLDWH